MFSLGLILAFLFLALFGLASTVNYCDPSLCTNNNIVKHHIGCDNNGEFGSDCQEPAIIEITPKMQKSILFWHNEYRNKVANGSLPGFQSAQRMTTVTWDTELEYLAGLNVLTCKLEHDECHNTLAYKYSGQNLASQYHLGAIDPSTYENITVLLIKKWFNENTHANQGDVDKCTASGLSRNIGHFTAMIQEKSAKIGCGLAKFKEIIKGNLWYVILFSCDYSFTNVIDMPIYVKGQMGSACETGPNPDFNGLCSLAEYVPPIHDLDTVDLPAGQRSPHVKITVPTLRPMYKPALASSLPPPKFGLTRETRRVPSARMAELMKTAERVVKPYNPNETNFYIKTEPNPEVKGIIRPVPVVTWRGPVYNQEQLTNNAVATIYGPRPTAAPRTFSKRYEPVQAPTRHGPPTAAPRTIYKDYIPVPAVSNPPVRSIETRRIPSARMAALIEKAERAATPYNPNEKMYVKYQPNPEVRGIIRPVPVITWRGQNQTSSAYNQQGQVSASKRIVPNAPVRSNDIIRPVPVITRQSPSANDAQTLYKRI